MSWLDSKTVRFKVGNYSKTSTLIIDPVLIFSSFTGSKAYFSMVLPLRRGPMGRCSQAVLYSAAASVSPGAYQTSYQGGSANGGVDMGIFKFSADGSQRVYSNT